MTIAFPNLDYGRSFVAHTKTGSITNSPRISVIAYSALYDGGTLLKEFLLGAACASEVTFPTSGRKIKSDAMEAGSPFIFQPVWTLDNSGFAAFRLYRDASTFALLSKNDDPGWGCPIHQLRRHINLDTLDTDAKVIDAVMSALPLIAQVQINDASTGLTAAYEFPVTTINQFSEDHKWQIDAPALFIAIDQDTTAVPDPRDRLGVSQCVFGYDAQEVEFAVIESVEIATGVSTDNLGQPLGPFTATAKLLASR